MLKQTRASYFSNFKNAQYCALSGDPIPDYLKNGDEVYIINTAKRYLYDADSGTLIEQPSSGGGSGYDLQSKGPVTPTKSEQIITPDNGYYGLSDVTIGAIPSEYQDVSSVTASAADVLYPKVIIDSTGTEIQGTIPNNGAIYGTIDGLTVISYSIPVGYTSGGMVSLTNAIENALAAI